MEMFIAPRLTLDQETQEIVDFLDLDSIEIVNACIIDLRIFEHGKFNQITETAINRTFTVWQENRHDVAQIREKIRKLETLIYNWLFDILPEDILSYLYCRSIVRMENSSDPEFIIMYLTADALYDEIYRSSPSNVRESIQRHKSRRIIR